MLFALSSAAAAQQWLEVPVPLRQAGEAWREGWRDLDREPAWLRRPRGVPDHCVFTTASRSSGSKAAVMMACRQAPRVVAERLLDHLEPAFGNPMALRISEELQQRCELVDLVSYPLDDLQGGAAAVLCWRLPLRASLAAFPAAERSRIEWVLLQPFVVWREVEQAPDWAVHVPTKSGRFRVVFETEGHTVHAARDQATAWARGSMHEAMFDLLAPVLGRERAEQAIRAGLDRLLPVQRAFTSRDAERRSRGLKGVAWTLWEVPIRQVVRAAPESERAAVRAALEQHRR
ncbi:MAG: hypothetical protein KAI24_03425 [Planctomycetes bacterium]|nr:hypothetical protein [Planctomycetota bacterium]